MKYQVDDATREKILALIESEYESDAAFERALGLPEKTVNNWRRQRSNSFMKMLPVLSEKFGVPVNDLLDIPLRRGASELSEEEAQLLRLYRRCRTLSRAQRAALQQTLSAVITLYLSVRAPTPRRREKDTSEPE